MQKMRRIIEFAGSGAGREEMGDEGVGLER